MNKIEDFTEGSEWVTPRGVKLKFHSFIQYAKFPLFTCDQSHDYLVDNDGIIVFAEGWEHFKKVVK